MKPKTPNSHDKSAALYVHIPFCLSKCRYCSFCSFPRGNYNIDGYVEALLQQTRDMGVHPWSREHRFTTLFIGGGTPTILNADQLPTLIATLLASYAFVPDAEITIEANPNTIDLPKLQALRQAGVNRLSIGIQALDDGLLHKIGRTHTVREGMEAFRAARKAGFDNINLDLIYGLPDQTPDLWAQTLNKACELSPEHFSVYELMVEEGSVFAERQDQGTLTLPGDAEMEQMEQLRRDIFAERGYNRYEISNFCRDEKQCRHNIQYWRNRSYLGLGAGAVSCLSGIRLRNLSDPQQFTDCLEHGIPPYADAECLSRRARFRETVIMGLRLLEGIDIEDLTNRFGFSPTDYYGETLNKLIDDKLINIEKEYMKLTTKGLPLANRILAELV